MNANYWKWVEQTGTLLVIVGALNWGLVGLLGFNLVETIFGAYPGLLTKIVYDLVGLAALYTIYMAAKK